MNRTWRGIAVPAPGSVDSAPLAELGRRPAVDRRTRLEGRIVTALEPTRGERPFEGT